MMRVFVLAACAFAGASTPPSLWPQPRSVSFGSMTVQLASTFECIINSPPQPANGSQAIEIVRDGCTRALSRIFSTTAGLPSSFPVQVGSLTSLLVNLASVDDTLQLGIIEAYSLSVPAVGGNVTLVCATAYGCLRGFETFVQLTVRQAVLAAPVVVDDAPRFSHRGVLVDTARHFLPLATLRAVVEGMAADKLNTLHLHLTDAQAFSFASTAVPGLALGAWAPSLAYSHADLADLVAFAKARGVRVVPEVESPAHSQSWGVGRPDLVLDCGYGSVLDPTNEATYAALAALLGEIADIFPDDALHVGVDEVDVTVTSCYNNSRVAAWMPTVNISAGDWKGVVRYHLARVQAIVRSVGKRMSAWQEAADHYGLEPGNPTNAPPDLDRDTAIHVRAARRGA